MFHGFTRRFLVQSHTASSLRIALFSLAFCLLLLRLFLSAFCFLLLLLLSVCDSPPAILLEHGFLLAASVRRNGSTAVPWPVRQGHLDGAGLGRLRAASGPTPRASSRSGAPARFSTQSVPGGACACHVIGWHGRWTAATGTGRARLGRACVRLGWAIEYALLQACGGFRLTAPHGYCYRTGGR